MNATTASVKEIKELGKRTEATGINIILMIDEIHRLSTVQMDALLPLVENNIFVFIGATTESPFHTITSPLLSRCQIFTLEPLTEKELATILLRTVQYIWNYRELEIDSEAALYLVRISVGDARKLISTLEMAVDIIQDNHITMEVMRAVAPSKYMVFSEGMHYNLASATQGSIQASDPDAAVYWLAKWLESGEDPRYIARRVFISAGEDACSNPICTAVAHAALVAAEKIGRPECDILLAQAVCLIASSPRDKAAAIAIWEALKDIREGVDVQVPKEMRDCHYIGHEKLGHGAYHDGMNQEAYIGVKKKYYRPWIAREK
jgi:putative ATPase